MAATEPALPDYVNYRDSSGNLIYGDNCHYDSNGRLVKILDSGSSTTTRAIYGYDQQGQLTSATVGGTRYTYTYDTAGNIQSKKLEARRPITPTATARGATC